MRLVQKTRFTLSTNQTQSKTNYDIVIHVFSFQVVYLLLLLSLVVTLDFGSTTLNLLSASHLFFSIVIKIKVRLPGKNSLSERK